jgi:regulator of sigma E protease
MDYIIGILAFVFVLGIIIAVHEAGHFFFARKANILCREYAFGMGPILLKKKKGETLYTLRAFPIGGFCAIAGEELEADPFAGREYIKLETEGGVIKGFYLDDSQIFDYPEYRVLEYDIFDAEQTGNLFMKVEKDGQLYHYSVDPQAMIHTGKQEIQIAPYNRTLGSKSKRARAMVMFGGPLMNFLLALLVFLIAGLIQGFPSSSSRLSELDPEAPTPAYEAGLRNDDVITYLKSGTIEREIKAWSDISLFMNEYTNQGQKAPITVTYLRGSSTDTTQVNPQVVFYNIGVFGEFTDEGIKIVYLAETNDKMSNNTELKVNDIIIDVEGVGYQNLSGMYDKIRNYEGNYDNEALNRLQLKVKRGSTTLDVKVKPYSKKIMNTQTTTAGEPIEIVKVAMGVSPSYEFNLGQSFLYSLRRTGGSFTAVFDTLNLLFTEESVTIAALSGPVGIFDMTKTLATQGIATLLNWMGLLSVNVGLLNLFPIPALDGGRLLFLGYEAITKKKPNPKVETILISVTMILLFGLMIFVTFNDVLRLFK